MKDLGDDEIRVIGDESPQGDESQNRSKKLWLRLVAVIVLCALMVLGVLQLLKMCQPPLNKDSVPTYFDSATVVSPTHSPIVKQRPMSPDTLVGITCQDTVVNDIPLTIYYPHNLRAQLHVGELRDQKETPDILMALVAADIRADNGEIVSAFVHHGEPVSRGIAKQGFCAIIDGKIMLGVDTETPLYERAIEHEGDFFRQYPLVSKGEIVENKVKNKAYRRALAKIGGEVVVVATGTEESLHDFAQSLVDVGAETAVNLVGSKMRTGWINLGDTIIKGEEKNYGPLPANVNYIVWSK